MRQSLSCQASRIMASRRLLLRTSAARSRVYTSIDGFSLPHYGRRTLMTTCQRGFADKSQESSQSVENDGEQGEAGSSSEEHKDITNLREEINQKEKQVAELKDKYLRQVAEFRNLQEITRRDVQTAKEYAISKFAKDILDTVDNLDRALSNVPEQEKLKVAEEGTNKVLWDFFEGIKMTQNVLENTLQKHGMAKIDPLGDKFDPHLHEATFEVPQADKEPGTVFHVQQKGFQLNDRVIRAAKVGVVKGPE